MRRSTSRLFAELQERLWRAALGGGEKARARPTGSP